MKKILGAYNNGNYTVVIFEDGTKIRANKEDKLVARFPESIDMKISDKCDRGCPMCHECSTPDGGLAPFLLDHPLFRNLHPYTELALGGGNVFEHPDLFPFLTKMRDQRIICNVTVHLDHFMENALTITALVKSGLLHGVGVSISHPVTKYELMMLQSIPNVVVHVIAGLVDFDTLESLSNENIKLLILGYKDYGRGINYLSTHPEVDENIQKLEDVLPLIKDRFTSISFDNLALEQLHMREHMTKKEWDESYMGDDGQFTMYIDMVRDEYAKSSTSPRRRIENNNIEVLFEDIKDGF